MPNSILPQDNDGQGLFNAISSFFSMFGIGKLLRMYMQQRTGSYRESFSKNTFYRFLSNSKINWLRFTSLLSQKVAGTIEPLTDEKRVNAFVVDDTLFERSSCKKTELGSRVFDHTDMRYKKGYRLMTLGWTDGNCSA